MLITNLYQYAQAKGLGLTPFRRESIAYRLVIGLDGKNITIEKHSGDIQVLKEGLRTGKAPKPFALYDQAEYVLGTVSGDPKRAAERCDAFWQRTLDVLSAAGDKTALKAVQAALVNRRWMRDLQKKVDKGWIALALQGDKGTLLDRGSVRRHFEGDFNSSMVEEGKHWCAISGIRCNAARLHDPIRGVPGTGGKVPLISFNTATAESGFKQGYNFTVSPAVMKGYTTALNEILETSSAPLGDNRKTTSTCVAFWGPSIAPDIAKVVHPWSTDEERREAWATLDKASREKTDEDLHVVFFKGSKGRIAVLHYDILKASDVVGRLLRARAHFQRYAPTPKDYVLPPFIRLLLAVGSLGPGEKKNRIPETLRVDTLHSFLLGREFRYEVDLGKERVERVGLALPYGFRLHALRALGGKNVVGRNTMDIRDKATAAVAWIEIMRPTDERRTIDMDTKEEPLLSDYVAINRDDDAPYHLGRVVALSESLKRQAHGRTFSSNGTLALFSRASSCPAAFLRDVTRQFLVHGNKIEGSRSKHHRFITLMREAQSLCYAISQNKALPIEDVGRLSIGYMDQARYNIAYTKYRREKAKEAAEKRAKEAEPAETDAAAE